MRIIHAVLCTILVLFAVRQYNDPDGYYWAPVYLLAAAWSFLAARGPAAWHASPFARVGAPISVALFMAGFASLAANIGPGWIHNEEAREALGYLICAGATTFAVLDVGRRTLSMSGRGRT